MYLNSFWNLQTCVHVKQQNHHALTVSSNSGCLVASRETFALGSISLMCMSLLATRFVSRDKPAKMLAFIIGIFDTCTAFICMGTATKQLFYSYCLHLPCPAARSEVQLFSWTSHHPISQVHLRQLSGGMRNTTFGLLNSSSQGKLNLAGILSGIVHRPDYRKALP